MGDRLSSTLAELVKGAANMPERWDPSANGGVGADVPLGQGELAKLTKGAAKAFEAARSQPADPSQLSAEFRMAAGASGFDLSHATKAADPDAMKAILNGPMPTSPADIQKLVADLVKTEITSSYPLSGSATGYGLAVYDLQGPSKKIFPVLTPFRNRIPRVTGQGSATQWKQITAISGSGGANAAVQHFVGELPSNTVGGMTLNLPPEIGLTGSDKSQAFKVIGASESVGMIAQFAGRGYEDLRALASLSALQALMLSEERGLWSARTTAVAAPTISSATAGAATGTQVAITGATTNVYIKVTGVTMMGESAASAATAGVAVTNGTSVVTVVIATPTANYPESYNVYVSTGAADPGDASRFLAGKTGYNTFVLQGALPTSGSTPPAADTTASANAYAGVFASLEGGTSPYITSLNGQLALSSVQNAFSDRYDNLKADPDEMWASSFDRRSLSDLVLAQTGAAQQGARILLQPGADGITAGVIVSQFLNESTGKTVPVRVHPWFKPGNIAGVSYALPFPNSNVPNVWEVKLNQDYLAIDWPVIDMNYRSSVVAFGALIAYAPDFNFWIRGIQQANATTKNQ